MEEQREQAERRHPEQDCAARRVDRQYSIFCPPSQSLDAVVGVILAGAPPWYTAVFACQANMNTSAHRTSNIASRPVSFCSFRWFRISRRFTLGNNPTAKYYTLEP